MNRSLSGSDIIKLVGYSINIVCYNELENYNNIFDLLGKNLCCVILYNYGGNNQNQYGHWCCVYLNYDKKGKPRLIFFDSYGCEIDDEDENFGYIKDFFKQKEYTLYPFLSKLLLDSGMDIHYNNYQLQSFDDGVSTCGRWCAMVLITRADVDDFYYYYSKFKNPDKEIVKDTDFLFYLDDINSINSS
jgi:hypothetical protein